MHDEEQRFLFNEAPIEREQWIRAQEQATLHALTPVTRRSPLDDLRAVRPDLADRLEAAQRKVADLVWGQRPRQGGGRAVDWIPEIPDIHRDFVHIAMSTGDSHVKGGNPMATKEARFDFGLMLLAGQTGLPYEVLIEAADAEAASQHTHTWRIADTTVHTAVLAMRKHVADGCGVRDCAGPNWDSLVASLTYEQLALVFGAATQMLMEYLPESTKEELKAKATEQRPDTGGNPIEHHERVTARVVERARAMLAARAAERFPDGVTPGDATVPAGDVTFDGEQDGESEK